MESARVIVEVVAGILPGTPMPEHTKAFAITSKEWNEADEDGRTMLLIRANGQALAYAGLLMLQPDRFNWVKTEWIWL